MRAEYPQTMKMKVFPSPLMGEGGGGGEQFRITPAPGSSPAKGGGNFLFSQQSGENERCDAGIGN